MALSVRVIGEKEREDGGDVAEVEEERKKKAEG